MMMIVTVNMLMTKMMMPHKVIVEVLFLHWFLSHALS